MASLTPDRSLHVVLLASCLQAWLQRFSPPCWASGTHQVTSHEHTRVQEPHRMKLMLLSHRSCDPAGSCSVQEPAGAHLQHAPGGDSREGPPPFLPGMAVLQPGRGRRKLEDFRAHVRRTATSSSSYIRPTPSPRFLSEPSFIRSTAWLPEAAEGNAPSQTGWHLSHTVVTLRTRVCVWNVPWLHCKLHTSPRAGGSFPPLK